MTHVVAPENGPHARQQFPRFIGFGDIVIGADFQTDDAVTGITSFLENGPGKAEFSGT